ncbi:MAG: hypothetical protein EKK47_13010 [Burkholderiales bacterium]|jgi:hypothetical protein|nr:MAG: hypothetical protein EKK47_13010 [Burkholderiales bacterium]
MADRRSVLRGLLLAAMSQHLQAAPPALQDGQSERTHWVREGEAALMRGEPEQAMQAFERGGAMGHEPAIELGMVRAAMQAGHYRQAMGFAAHTAGEHARDADCVAVYIWLLRLGGQLAMAEQLMQQTLSVLNEPAARGVLEAVQAQWQRGWPQADGVLRTTPLRLAPYAHGEVLPTSARMVASACLMPAQDGVQRVLAPALDALKLRCEPRSACASNGAPAWWARNGLGQTMPIALEAPSVDGLVSVWRVVGKLSPVRFQLAARDAFAGSPAYALSYAMGRVETPAATPSESTTAPAAWPLMRMGFAGRTDDKLGPLLGVEGLHGPWSRGDDAIHPNPMGGPVWNAQGRWIGMALAGASGQEPDRLWSQSAWRRWSRIDASPASAGMALPTPMPVDEIYEQSLLTCLQLLTSVEPA